MWASSVRVDGAAVDDGPHAGGQGGAGGRGRAARRRRARRVRPRRRTSRRLRGAAARRRRGRPCQPPRVCARNAAAGSSRCAVGVVVDGGLHRAPRVGRGDRGVRPEGERDAGLGGGRANGFMRAPPLRPAARRTSRRDRPTAPSNIGCTLAMTPSRANERHGLDRGHLAVLEPVPRRPQRRRRRAARRPRRSPGHGVEGGVADAVEAGLDPEPRCSRRRARRSGRRRGRRGRSGPPGRRTRRASRRCASRPRRRRRGRRRGRTPRARLDPVEGAELAPVERGVQPGLGGGPADQGEVVRRARCAGRRSRGSRRCRAPPGPRPPAGRADSRCSGPTRSDEPVADGVLGAALEPAVVGPAVLRARPGASRRAARG